MSVMIRTIPAAARGAQGDRRCFWLVPAGISAALLLSGCATPLRPVSGADPADPSVPVASVRPTPSIAPYTRMRPADPAPWLEQNRRVAPRAKE